MLPASSTRTVGLLFVVLLLILNTPASYTQTVKDEPSRPINGGFSCAACTVLLAITEQTTAMYNTTVVPALERLCHYLPRELKPPCHSAVNFLGPLIVSIVSLDAGPDIACHALNFCHTEAGTDTCTSFQRPPVYKLKSGYIETRAREVRKVIKRENPHWDPTKFQVPGSKGASICSVPGIKEICEWIERTFHQREPFVDGDSDGFSTIFAARGTAWRGKDCSDLDSDVHPGARPLNNDEGYDSNCNGIYGIDWLRLSSFEEVLCKDTQEKGVAILGDSIGAHFHLPPEWLNVTKISKEVFVNAQTIIENEIDWPSMSAATGHGKNLWPEVIHGPIDSIYTRMFENNRCNHRDYQNLAFNGATTFDAVDIQINSLSRNKNKDKPLLLFYAFFGNDVCNRFVDTFAHMTTPEEIYNNTMTSMDMLHKVMPNNSDVVILSLLDGRVLFDTMQNRTHPLGAYWGDFTYSNMYDYFNCLHISPCRGWLNTNQTIRDLTAKRVVELNRVLKDIGAKYKNKYPNFKIHYMESPIDEVIADWQRKGGETWQLIEPADGFHTNQIAQALFAKEFWKELIKLPGVIGPPNPNNKYIYDIFGDQGGY